MGNILIDKVMKNTSLSSLERLATYFEIDICHLENWYKEKEDIPKVYNEKLQSLLPYYKTSESYGPVTIVYAPSGFYDQSKYNEIYSENVASLSLIFDNLFKKFHNNPKLEAFIIDKEGEVIFSINDLNGSAGAVARNTYFMVIEDNEDIFPKNDPDYFLKNCSFPDFKSALISAKSLVDKGLYVKLFSPTGEVIGNDEIIYRFSSIE